MSKDFNDIVSKYIDYESLFNYTQDIANDGFFVWLVKENYEYMSPRFKEILGYKEDEMENTPESWQKIIFKKDLDRLWKLVNESFKNNKPFFDTVRYKHKNGKTIWVFCRGHAYKRDEQGNPTIVIGTHTDITKLKETEEMLLQTNKQLDKEKQNAEYANKTKTTFITEINHEVRAPLNAILGFGQLLELDAKTDKQKEYSALIIKYGNYLLHILNDLSNIAKLELDKLEFKQEQCNLQDILSASVDIAKSKSYHIKGVTIDKIPKINIKFINDKHRLTQIFVNILSNAIKYNKPNGKVFINILQKKENVEIHIKDTGIGISKENLANLFQPFNRFNENKEIEGTGLGLAITKQIINRMNGNIYFESKVGIGTDCFITLPL